MGHTHARGPRDKAALHDALDGFFALPRADQLEHLRVATDYLGPTQRPETPAERQLRRQAETLKALEAVQDNLHLTADKAPTADEFDLAAKRLGLGEDRNTVRRAFGAWSAATATLTGGKPPETAAQKHIRRQVARRARGRPGHIESISRSAPPEAPSPTSSRRSTRVCCSGPASLCRTRGNDRPQLAFAELRLHYPLLELWPVSSPSLELDNAGALTHHAWRELPL